MTLAEYIQAYIKEHSLTIREFSRNCGLSHTMINGIMNDPKPKPSLDTLEKISNYTGIKLISVLKMAYPESFDVDESEVTSDVVAQAFKNAPENVQDVILRLVGLK
jgi:transcriptional regulator with XRE-family HTH domain